MEWIKRKIRKLALNYLDEWIEMRNIDKRKTHCFISKDLSPESFVDLIEMLKSLNIKGFCINGCDLETSCDEELFISTDNEITKDMKLKYKNKDISKYCTGVRIRGDLLIKNFR